MTLLQRYYGYIIYSKVSVLTHNQLLSVQRAGCSGQGLGERPRQYAGRDVGCSKAAAADIGASLSPALRVSSVAVLGRVV